MQLNRAIIFLLTFALYSVSAVNPFPNSNPGYFMNCPRPEWLTKVRDFTTYILEGKQAKEDRICGEFCTKMMISSIKYTMTGSTSNNVTARVNQCYCGIFLGDSINSPGVAEDAITILNQVASTIHKHGIPETGYIEEKTIGLNQSNIFDIAIHCADDQTWLLDKITHFETSRLGSMTRSII